MNLAKFGVDELHLARDAVHAAAEGVRSFEGAAQRITDELFALLRHPDGGRACALVRLYKTHPFRGLDADLRRAAEQVANGSVPEAARCLTLLGTSGLEPAWNDRRRSHAHRAIPLLSEAAINRLPMVAALIDQLGIDVGVLVAPSPVPVTLHHRSYDVFHVPDAAGSPYVPAQDFVAAAGVRSVVGFGGLLPSGDMFATILFTTVPVDERTADLFRPLAIAVKAVLVPYTFDVWEPAVGSSDERTDAVEPVER